MAIIELVFPLLKSDSQSLFELSTKKSEIFRSFLGVDGLKTILHGRIMEDEGIKVQDSSGRTVLMLEWDNVTSFHDFYPQSSKFRAFVAGIKPYLAGPATPELYETPIVPAIEKSISVMQVVKAPITSDIKSAWKSVEDGLSNTKACTYSAGGIDANEGVFLGLIGWNSVEEYEQHGKDRELLRKIGGWGGGEAKILVVELSAVQDI